jgi:aspyridone synthetase (hybrid polyketide synthase/nonribosomal peptide synthetase)
MPIRRIEVHDINIRCPIVVPDSREGVETTFTVRLEDLKDPKHIAADFKYYYSSLSGSMEPSCDGRIIIYLGEASEHELPPYIQSPPGLYAINSDEGYDMFGQNGLTYTGAFRRLRDVQRRLDYAVAMAEWPVEELAGEHYTLHPAVLDVSWQNLFHARADPLVGKLPTAILPVHINRVTVNPNVLLSEDNTLRVRTESFITTRKSIGVVGDVHIYNSSSGEAAVQMESVVLDPIAPQTEDQDRRLFFDTVFKMDPSLRLMEPPHHDPSSETSQRTKELAADIERVVLFYIQRVLEGLPQSQRSGLTWYHQKLVQAWEASVALIREGRHPVAERAWLIDKSDIPEKIFSKWPDTVDLELVRAVGENFLDFLKRREALLEIIMRDNMAGRLYSEGCGFTDVNGGMVGVLQQISHKFPQAKYLEIGAGTGSTVF